MRKRGNRVYSAFLGVVQEEQFGGDFEDEPQATS